MDSIMDTKEDILQQGWLKYITNKLGQEPWVTVYSSEENDWGFALFFSALIPNEKVNEVLDTPSWDLHIGDGMPGCSISYVNDEEIVRYHRYGRNDGIEPLVLCRTFHGVKEGYMEISEEFRLFHNLYHDKTHDKYIAINDNGDEEDVIICQEKCIKVKLKYLKQFLAIKEMHLALYFSIDQYSNKTLEELGLKESSQLIKQDNIIYDFIIGDWMPLGSDDKRKAFSRLLGKKLIPGMEKEKCGIWPYEEEKQYAEFIIGFDENGEPVSYTCNPEVLSNYFGANPGAPHYLTPVFFNREVLIKYYSQPEKYSVEDGYLRCKGLWGLRMDNNHERFVVVFLGDLGRDLSYKEQLYWKSYNVPPEGRISDVNWKRSFLGEFADPEKADLNFKYIFNWFQPRWEKRFGWPLFKPLGPADEHYFKTLRVPLSNNQAEFDQQVLALAKVMIDSLNEKEIEKYLPDKRPDEKGISKFDRFLEALGLTDYKPYIVFMRNLWDLRHGTGHRKGDAYKRAVAYFQIGKKELLTVFEDILKEATQLLIYLDKQLLNDE